jgi:transposase
MIYFLGIDVSKSTLDVALVKAGAVIKEQKIENDKASLRRFLLELKQECNLALEDLVVCMEHTGIYNYRALEVLHKAKVKVCLEPALHIKQSMGMTRGKDDRVDARRIAQYAYKSREQLAIWQPKRAVFQKLQALLSLRERLIKAKTQLEIPLQESAGYVDLSIVKSMKASSQPVIKAIKKEVKELESRISTLIQEDEAVKKQHGYITSVPGVGDITALNLIIRTEGFTRIKEPKRFACYAGVAPFKHQSGSSIRGKTRVSKLANMTMKKLFHLAAMSAIQCSDEMRVFYQRKVSEGKNKMSVINAVRNKLISRVFACVKQERNYEKNYIYPLLEP